jgi:hypothetical protein
VLGLGIRVSMGRHVLRLVAYRDFLGRTGVFLGVFAAPRLTGTLIGIDIFYL